jgi:hypothetical protein
MRVSYGRLCKQGVYHHLTGGDAELHGWMKSYGIEPELRLASGEAERLKEIAQQRGRTRLEILEEAVADFLDKYRRKGNATKA